jgi:hypothetical protein
MTLSILTLSITLSLSIMTLGILTFSMALSVTILSKKDLILTPSIMEFIKRTHSIVSLFAALRTKVTQHRVLLCWVSSCWMSRRPENILPPHKLNEMCQIRLIQLVSKGGQPDLSLLPLFFPGRESNPGSLCFHLFSLTLPLSYNSTPSL